MKRHREATLFAALLLLFIFVDRPCNAEITFAKRVSAGADDAEQSTSTGVMYLTQDSLDMAVGPEPTHIVGMRFTAVAIPKGAKITKAYIQFASEQTSSGTADLVIWGQAADNAATFTTSANDISARTLTTASVAWSPANWASDGAAGAAQQSADISTVIQEIVNRASWASGNALAILVNGSGTRKAQSYDNDSAICPQLVVEYTTSAQWKLDEASGTTAADASGFGNTGAVTGTATWTTGIINNGFSFDGSTKIQATGLISSPKSVTVAAWANLTVADTNGAEVVSLGDRFVLRLDEGALTKATFWSGSAWVTVSVSQKYAGTGWHHFAATFDDAADSFKLYIDGVLAASLTTSSSISYTGAGSNTVIGRHGNAATNRDFTGILDDVRVYGYAMTAAQVGQVYGLVGSWKFAEGTGANAADSSLLANNATLNGATWETDCAGNNALQTNLSGGIAQTVTAFSPPSEGTVAFWMRGAGTPAARGRVMGVNGDWEIRQEPNGTLSFDLGGSPFVGNEPFSTLDPVDTNGKWYHIAAVFNDVDNSYSVYIDGKLRTSGISPVDLVPQLAGTLSFGTRTGSTEYWKGALRDFRVYNRRLSAAEIAELYGLVGYWKLDEISGTAAADSSSAGNNGTLTNSPTWTTGKIAGGLQLNGSSQYVSAPTSSSLSITSQITLTAWAKSNSMSGWHMVLNKGTTTSTSNYFLGTSNNQLSFGFYNSGWKEFTTSSAALSTNTWYHFAATFNNNSDEVKIYLNGNVALSTTTTGSPIVNTENLLIGSSEANEYWNGTLDDVRIYNRVLCPTEVQALYNGGTTPGVKIIKWVEIQ